jgi:hypothetical protein
VGNEQVLWPTTVFYEHEMYFSLCGGFDSFFFSNKMLMYLLFSQFCD